MENQCLRGLSVARWEGVAAAGMECSGMPAKGLGPILSIPSSQADSNRSQQAQMQQQGAGGLGQIKDSLVSCQGPRSFGSEFALLGLILDGRVHIVTHTMAGRGA